MLKQDISTAQHCCFPTISTNTSLLPLPQPSERSQQNKKCGIDLLWVRRVRSASVGLRCARPARCKGGPAPINNTTSHIHCGTVSVRKLGVVTHLSNQQEGKKCTVNLSTHILQIIGEAGIFHFVAATVPVHGPTYHNISGQGRSFCRGQHDRCLKLPTHLRLVSKRCISHTYSRRRAYLTTGTILPHLLYTFINNCITEITSFLYL
jgi:hypothetical protein